MLTAKVTVMTKNWTNRTAFITGGSSGIGLALAKELFSRGANLVLIARDMNKLEMARNGLLEAYRNECEVDLAGASKIALVSLDISKGGETKTVLTETANQYGGTDLLINCAGISYSEYFQETPYSAFESIMDINVTGTWNVLQALVPGMMERGSGSIVTISSIAGFIGVFGYSAYSASKFALFGMMESLRAELKPYGISVHVVCPPDTDTPQLRQEDRTKPPETRAISGNAKVLSPDIVAKTVLMGVERGHFVIIPGFSGKMIYLINRYSPFLTRFLMDRKIAKARKARL
jgi:3-dehydrosphinganine reductase